MNENFHSSKDVQSQYFRDTFIFFCLVFVTIDVKDC